MERETLDSQTLVGPATTAEPRSRKPAGNPTKGLNIDALFCPADVESPFDTVQWELRTAAIKGEGGDVVFQQQDCEIPATWSQLATNVVVSKYFYGEMGTPERETSVRQLIHRVVRTIADWGTQDGYFAGPEDGERFYRELAWLCLHQHVSFNSPVWFNVGLHHEYGVKGAMCNWHWDAATQTIRQPENPYEYPQASACFIQSVQDNMEDIMELARSEAMLFKFGSGTGTDLSTLRSHREKLSGGGKPSGPLSFMRIYDQIAGVVRSGGKTRRAAKMQSLKVHHPDILEFVECKCKEEEKARVLVQKGYDPEQAYSSILFQNANLSVRLTDEFMQTVEQDKDWTTHWITEPSRLGPTYKARELFTRMAKAAWACGDPGVQYDTTINRWHTCPNSGAINASNPCVTGDTLVATGEGLRTISELVDQKPQVVGADGRLHFTTRVIPTGVRPVYRLRTENGYELKLTADHRVLTQRGDVPAAELCVGDKIQIRRVHFGCESLSQEVAEELGERLGAGEQNVGRVLERLEISQGGFISRGVLAAIDGPSDHLICLNEDSVAAVLRGFYRAQGSQTRPVLFSNARYAELQHVSRELLQQIQLILLGFGVKSALHGDDDSVIHRLCILPHYYPKFKRIIDGEAEQVHSDWVEYDEITTPLEHLGNQPVFDLTEPVTQHFVANGLVVHNCSEYMFIDDSACNLASVNLMKYRREDGTFDAEGFAAACRLTFIAQEILVDHASYPTQRIALNSHRFRPLGLGYSNLGSLIMTSGFPYDSDEARGLCSVVTALLHGSACRTSAELANAVGPFDEFEKNRAPMLRVMEMHWEKVEQIKHCPEYLKAAARKVWDEVLASGRRYGFRNAQATVLAPTGTISFMMDCDTTGIEPDIALVKYKQLAGGGMMKIVNQTVPLALQALGYSPEEVISIVDYINQEDTIEGAADLKPDHLPVFDCAFQAAHGTRFIPWKAHVRMMGAAQPFISGAISKTVNMPRESTPEDIAGAYLEGWKLGLKALAVYRDGSKEAQPLSTKQDDKEKEKTVPKPRRERLPDTRRSITHKFSVAGHEGYITVGLYADGRPGEMFITMAKEGSTIGGLMDCFGTAVSMSLQYGVPLEVYVNKFSHTRFEPQGYTKNPDIRIAKSIVDYIFRWLGITFLPGFREANKLLQSPSSEGGAKVGGPDTEAERGPAAKMAGGPNPGQGSATPVNTYWPSGSSAKPTSTSASGPANGHTNGNGHTASGNGSSAKPGSAKSSTAVQDRPAAASPDASPSVGGMTDQFAAFQADAPSCDNCGAITVRNGNCYLCHVCGSSMGCS